MKTSNVKVLAYILTINILLSGCSPSQFLGPTFTPTLPPTLTPSSTPTKEVPPATSSPTPEPTLTPEPRYKKILDPDQEALMTRITLKEDIQSGKLAEWILSQPVSELPISKDPSKLKYVFQCSQPPGVDEYCMLSARDDKGSAARNSMPFGIFKINPTEFGIEGKNDVYVVASIIQDPEDRRMVQFGLVTKKYLTDFVRKMGCLSYPAQGGLVPQDTLNTYWDKYWRYGGTGTPDDYKELEKGKVVYGAQGKSVEEIDELFQGIAEHNSFADQDIQTFNTTIFSVLINSFAYSTI